MSKGKDISTMFTKEENKKNGRAGYYQANTFDAGFAEGRNECIDEITGGEVDGEINA